jgi:hypothetical protein
MSEALGIGKVSSTNVPGIADMYALGGIGGILIGMFLWGICLQLLMNRIGRGLGEKGTFIYIGLLWRLTNIERDMVAMIGGAVETVCILLVLSKVVYGGPLFSLRSIVPRRATR